jgi:outer membrane protein OmpA-like peptidoglycan-associated protein
MKKSLIAFAAGAVVLTGCTTVDPLTGQTQASRATKGAVIGTAGGAAVGALIGGAGGNATDVRRGALIGAGIGLLAGGSIGLYMDQQEAQLRQRLQGTGVDVVRRGNEIILIMPSNITFASGSSNLNPAFQNTLNGVAIVLQEYPKTLVDVVGHTDSDGDDSFNLTLSQNRANSVANYLSTRGVDSRRFLVRGLGESAPIASNATAEGKAQNRRVEVRLQPLQ